MDTIKTIIERAKYDNATTLSLSGLDLDDIPDDVYSLVNLEELNLSRNNLQDIPSKILQLENLKTLNLYGNKLVEIPKSIYQINSLDSLVLSVNPLKHISPEIGLLSSLHRLSIAQTDIGFIPSEIGELFRLHSLNLSSPLGRGKISALPEEIGSLENLLILYLAGNKLTSFPEKIMKLSKIFTLDLSGNSLEKVPYAITQLTSLEVLDLGGNLFYGCNNIDELPKEIGLLTQLKNLNLSYNKLKSLPDEIYSLNRLETLNLKANRLKNISNRIALLSNIKHICLDQNELESLPSDIGNLPSLRFFEAKENKLRSLPLSLKNTNRLVELDLSANDLNIPPEISSKVNEPQEILRFYFKTHQGNFFTLNESKMLVVGQGGVGKTSLARVLIWDEFFDGESKTEGISIHKWNLQQKVTHSNEDEIQINLWDFGGQEIMHATHQFFLTKRSLYVLVLDSRLTQEENRVEYWLKIIQSFGGESPVLIVGNKIDQHPLDIDRTGLQKKYPNIVGILETSAATGAGIETLKAAITEQVNNLPHVRDLLPETWFTVKTKLEGLGKQSNFITHDKYLDLCAENEVSDETSQRTLIGFLHDLGVVLHFQDDPRLEALGILNPQWVTNGVYKILNSHALFQNKGVLTVSMLDEILNLPEYPRGKRLFIVDMMKKFELCYDIPYGYDVEPDKTFLVPDLLPKDQPDLNFNGVPAFEYAYPVLPSSVITRFIVRMNQKIDDGLVWRTGVMLKIGENKALVKADIEDRKITIAIDGVEYSRRDALSAIRYELGEIHNSIKGLNPQQRVPVPNAPLAEPLKYEYLLKLERAGQETVLVENGNDLVTVNVRQMLSAIETEAQRGESATNVTTIYNVNTGGGDFTGRDKSISAGDHSIVVGGNVSDSRISTSYSKVNSAEINPELKETMKQLAEAVDAMLQKLPAEQATEVAEDYGKLADEAVKPKPNQKWYSVSIEGLIKAAENLDKLGTPVISLSRKVLSLLTGGVVK
jgi:internalin A